MEFVLRTLVAVVTGMAVAFVLVIAVELFGWVASRIGNRVAGTIVALLLACALVFNLAMRGEWRRLPAPPPSVTGSRVCRS